MKINPNDTDKAELQVKKVIEDAKEFLKNAIHKETEALRIQYEKDIKAIQDKYSSVDISYTTKLQIATQKETQTTPKKKVDWNPEMLELFKTYTKNSEVKNALKKDFGIDISESSVAYRRTLTPKVKKSTAKA